MRCFVTAVMVLAAILLTGCCSMGPEKCGRIDPATWIADPPPVLCGTVVDQYGKPVFGATVHVYSGIATYSRLATVETDRKGRYRVWITHGARLRDKEGRCLAIPVGIAVVPPSHEQEDGRLDWTGSVPNLPNHETRKDFTIQVADPDGRENRDAQRRKAAS